jgi:hypothetical protein
MGLFVSGCEVMMDMCEHSNEPLGNKEQIFSVLPQGP